MSDLELADHWERINRVVNEFLKGNTDPTKIAKITGFTRKDVIEYLNEWRGVVQSDRQVQMRAREALSGADAHYSMLIKEAWDIIQEATNTQNLAQRTAAVKLVADIQQKQIDMLQKAGVLENNEMAEKIIATEEKQQLLADIIKDVVSQCDTCKPKVMARLSEVTDKAEAF
jgi:predicted transcriptional regulator